jgi:ubiquitin C-terminal hydrolase
MENDLDGGKKPLSLYTKRIINSGEIAKYLEENSSKGLCGTLNLGNTCYMSSSITCLMNIQELVYYFLKGDYKKDLNPKKKIIPEQWNELVIKYWKEKNNYVDIEDFKDRLADENPQFQGYRQQDANELLITLLHLLNEGLIGDDEDEEIPLIFPEKNKSDKEESKKYWNYNLKLNDSIITELFCGQLKQVITCPECNESKRTFECFNILNLPIPKVEINYKYKFEYFYVPKYGIRRPVRIKYKKYNKEATFAQCFSKLRKEERFIYKDNIGEKIVINETNNKKSLGFINEKTTIEDSVKEKTFYFCYDIVDEKENIKIPIYLKIEGGKLSDYPRIIFLSENATLDDLRFKIYCLIRKYFYSPLKGEEIEVDPLTKNIVNYIRDKRIDDEPILKSIDEEYQSSFKSFPLKEEVQNFIKNMPFVINLVNNNDEKDKIILSHNFLKLSEQIKEKANINNFYDPINDFLELLDDYYIEITFDKTSEYINNKFGNFNLNICTIYNGIYNDDEDKKLSLEECFKHFIKEEKLKEGEEWNCPKCDKKVLANKKYDFYYLPKIFVICFTRFIQDDNNWLKNEENIGFKTENMDMKDFMIGPDKEHSKYDLFAVIQHSGTMENGHYTSICQNSGNWYNFNDTQFNMIDINETQNSYSYILFYRRQTD